MFMFFFFI